MTATVPTIDEHESMRVLFNALTERVAVLESRPAPSVKLPAACSVNVLDFGCRLNDPTFDNGPILTAAFAKAGTKTGDVNVEFYLPGGALYCHTGVATPFRTGLSIRGNGTTYGLTEGSYTGKSWRGGPASRIVYTGPPDPPGLILNGNGTRVEGVALQRGEWTEPRTKAKADGSVGLRIAGCDNARGVNTGHHQIRSLAVMGFDTAVEASSLPYPTHADNVHFGLLQVQNCNRAIHLDNHQTNNWIIDELQLGFDCDTGVEVDQGGDVIIGVLHLNAATLLLKINKRDSHSSSYKIGFLNVDQNSTGWRLIEALGVGPLQFSVWGNCGKNIPVGLDWVKLNADLTQTTLDIKVFQNGKLLAW